MVAPFVNHCLEAEQIGKVTLVTFSDPELLEESSIQAIGGQLLTLVDTFDCRHLVLNLEAVKKLSTMMLGHLVAVHKRVQQVGGRVALCGIKPDLHEILEILKLSQLFAIYGEEQEALQTF